MTENRKAPENCHDCGLEAIDYCETQNKHLPYDETLPPCRFCVRNRKRLKANVILADFYSETWTLDAEKTPMIEDPDPHERELLKMLHVFMNGGEIYAKCR